MTRFEWEREMLASKTLAPTTRFVLLAIGTHANRRHEWRAFPSIRTLVDETGLSSRAIGEHINSAITAGWLVRSRLRKGRDWALSVYTLTTPRGGDAASLPQSTQGGDGASPRRDSEVVTLTHEAVTLTTRGGDPDDIEVVTQRHTNKEEQQALTKKNKGGSAKAALIPPSWSPSLADREWLRDELRNRGLDTSIGDIDAWVDGVRQKFIAHRRDIGLKRKDWSQQWRLWMDREFGYVAERRQGNGKASQTSRHILGGGTDYGQTGAIE